MELSSILLMALGLAMDAFAVSLAAAGSGRAAGGRAQFRLSFHFGLFQFFMPVIGWYIGARLAGALAAVDHWIAFGLLAIVGGRMILSGSRGDPDSPVPRGDPSRGLSLVALSVATSIDALAVGFSLALLHVNIWYPAAVIGVVTAALSFAGVRLGIRLGRVFGRGMEITGGVLLLFLGVRILVEHLMGGA